MHKHKRKAITNKENRDEENKMDKSNILDLIKEWSTEENHSLIRTIQPKLKEKRDHLKINSTEFIKSIGWMEETRPTRPSKKYSNDYNYSRGYDNYNPNYYKHSSSWTSKKNYYKNDYYSSEYRN